MTRDLHWDREVDVVCTGDGVAGLAGAISATDQGAEVLVASAPAPEAAVTPGGHPAWFTMDIDDPRTSVYLAEVSDDIEVAALRQRDDDLPIRPAPRAAAPARRVPPFIGSQLRDWAARCIPSPSGYLYTRVTDWTSAAMESADGGAIEVTEIGSMIPEPGDIMGSVLGWLDAEADVRGVEVASVTRFDRLVFEELDVIGAVFTTAEGPLAVRARHGVLLCGNGLSAGGAQCLPGAGDTALRVALVGRAASRFGRVELLTPAEG